MIDSFLDVIAKFFVVVLGVNVLAFFTGMVDLPIQTLNILKIIYYIAAIIFVCIGIKIMVEKLYYKRYVNNVKKRQAENEASNNFIFKGGVQTDKDDFFDDPLKDDQDVKDFYK